MDGRRSNLTLILAASFALAALAGCSSAAQKERKAQREGLSKSSKIFCEYINGEQYQDIDVFLNIQMAQKCDADKPFSISQYRTPSDIQGLMYCCGLTHKAAQAEPADAGGAKKDVKKDAKKDDKKDDLE